MNNQWSVSGNVYNVAEISGLIPQLPVAVFTMVETMAGIHLEKQADKFEFNYKVYGVETTFINRVVKTWNGTTGNMGLLLNGIKGTGKTVTAQLVANALNLPVILVTRDYMGLLPFMNQIQQDCIFMFDEYEKAFVAERGNSTKLLTIMDGVLKNGFRKFFLLTTNNPRLDENMQQRPSRVWYTKEYGNLDVEVIREVVDDKLIHKHLREQTVKFIAQLQLITMDIVSSVIQEVNIHEEEPEKFKDIFNVKKLDPKFDIISVELEGTKLTKRISESNIILENLETEDEWDSDIPLNEEFRPKYVNYGVIVSKEKDTETGNWVLKTKREEIRYPSEVEGELGKIHTEAKEFTLILEPVYVFNGSYIGLLA